MRFIIHRELFATIIKESIRRKIKSLEVFDELKKEVCGRFGATTPRNADIRDFYEQSLALEKNKVRLWGMTGAKLPSGKIRTLKKQKVEPWLRGYPRSLYLRKIDLNRRQKQKIPATCGTRKETDR
jgi:hypothetical protein